MIMLLGDQTLCVKTVNLTYHVERDEYSNEKFGSFRFQARSRITRVIKDGADRY